MAETTRVFKDWHDVPEKTIMVDELGDKFKVTDGVPYWWDYESGKWVVAFDYFGAAERLSAIEPGDVFGTLTMVAGADPQ